MNKATNHLCPLLIALLYWGFLEKSSHKGTKARRRTQRKISMYSVNSVVTLNIFLNDEGKDKSYCRSISLIATLVSKAILVPFITDSSLICHRITEGSRFKLTKIIRNRFAVWVSGFFFCCLQGFFDSGVAASRQGRSFFRRRFCLCLGGKGKNYLPRRYFTRYINSQPAVSRYVYSLCNGYK